MGFEEGALKHKYKCHINFDERTLVDVIRYFVIAILYLLQELMLRKNKNIVIEFFN